MTREEMFEAVKIALNDKTAINAVNKGRDPNEQPEITEETCFADLDLDSIDMVELVMDIEDKADIEIADDEAAAATTVGLMIDLVQQKVNNPENKGKLTPQQQIEKLKQESNTGE